MAGKQGKVKSQRRRSVPTSEQADGEVDENAIPCVFCHKSNQEVENSISTEELLGVDYDRWVQCSACKGWMHVVCLDAEIGKGQTVNDILWDRIQNLQDDEWNFTCPTCGENRPIPAQLEGQRILSRDELLDMNISEEFLLKRIRRDSFSVHSERSAKFDDDRSDTETKREKDDTKVFKPETANPNLQNVRLNAQTSSTVEQPQPGTSTGGVTMPGFGTNKQPISASNDMMQFMYMMQQQQQQFLQQQQQVMQQQQREQYQQQQFVIEQFLQDKEQDRKMWDKLCNSSAASYNHSPTGRHDSRTSNLKLPKVQLPRFDGTIIKWPEFWDLYENMVHNNDELPKIQKLSFLKQALTGSAAAVIASYKITEDNYDAVIQKLKARYDNKVIIKDQLFSQLRSVPVSGSKGTELRKTFDVTTSICTQLGNLGMDTNQEYLLNEIMMKFPNTVKQKLNEKKGKQTEWTVNLFWKYLEEYIQILEETWTSQSGSVRAEQPKSTWSFAKRKPTPQRFGKPHYAQAADWHNENMIGRGSGAGLFAAKNGKTKNSDFPSKNQQRFPCIYCNSLDHYADQCTKVTSTDERKKILNEAKRCFVCFGRNHMARNCSNPRKQKPCRGCQMVGVHHESLCEKWYQKRGTELKTTAPNTSNSSRLAGSSTNTTPTTSSSSRSVASTNPSTGMTCVSKAPKSMLQTACVDVINIGIGIPTEVKVLLDSGSNSTWISKDLAERLQLRYIGNKMVPVSTFYNPQPNCVQCYEAELELVTKDKRQVSCIVTVIDPLTAPISRQTITNEDREFLRDHPEYELAKGAVAEECAEFSVEMLIGGDYFWQFMTSGHRVYLPSGLQLLPSVFGYLIGGQCPNTSTNTGLLTVNSCFLSTQADDAYFVTNPNEYLPKISDLWDLEAVGIIDSPTINDDDRALQRFNETIRFEDDRYQVTWPWKSNDIELPTNEGLARGRFKSLCRRLNTDKDLLQRYDAAIQDQLKKGIIEKVTEESIVGSRVHYLPHHPVITPQKATTKVRIVYDASAKEKKGTNSLNDCLFRGPVILPDLCGLLLRFRTKPIAILSDIEKAFLQVGLQMPERDVTRFIWLKNPEIPNPENNTEIYRFCRVAFGIICSPFLLEATIKYHLDRIGTDFAKQISENIYVDNILILADDLESTNEVYNEAKKIFQRASMNLREWTSNCPEFLENLPDEDKVKTKTTKILGLTWNLDEDTISVNGFENRSPAPVLTKRDILHAVAKIFDPLGYFNPVFYHAKMFLRQLCIADKKWDDPLDNENVADWQRTSSILDKISTITIPRYVGRLAVKYELIIFCDASKNVYATAIYLRFPTSDNTCESHLVFSKLKLAPRLKNSKTGEMESITITRLELLAVWIGVKSANFVTKELTLPTGKRILFTDSQVVLKWLQSAKIQGTFVKNRLNEIRQTKDIIFRYVPSGENPADLMTRGLTVPELNQSKWWNGPNWLCSKDLPENKIPEFSAAEADEKIAKETPTCEIILCSGEGPAAAGILQNLDLTRFSSLRKLLGTVAYCIRFVTKVKGRLTASELENAENVLVKAVQHTHFGKVFDDLRKGNKNNLAEQLGLYTDDDGFLRCCGRIGKADMTYATKFPRLLPEKSVFTNLLIRRAHEQIFHYGDSHTLAQMRLKYWIPRGRRAVQKALKNCLVCRQTRGGAFKLPPVPVLPKERVLRARPFQYIGVDYMGPIYLRVSPDSKETTKAWICLFTCLVVRAVHLELANDLSAKQFTNCFRRFVSRRGKPDKVISDNAPNFKLTKQTLDQIWARIYTDPECVDYFSKKRIQWTFITEMAPWQGGFYERLVGVVKNALRCGLGKKYYTMDEMTTILTEVEAVVNSRPLTFISSSDGDSPTDLIITPAHLLGSHQEIGLPQLMDDPDDEYIPTLDSKQRLLKYYGNEQKIVNKFWESWTKNYLLSLRERPSNHKNSRINESREPRIGEIVLVKKENLPRGRWFRGRITNLSKRGDGAIHNATVRLSSGQTLMRPINHLYSLEIQPNYDEPINDQPSTDELPNSEPAKAGDQPVTSERLPRKAKQMARERITRHMRYDDIDDEDFFTCDFSVCGADALCGDCQNNTDALSGDCQSERRNENNTDALSGDCQSERKNENCGAAFFCFAGSVAVPIEAGEPQCD